ncbi:DUF1810 domain-containing protein [Variovorax sp. dw_954]|uniref:DUF1810 domain-containing protein n=1 Tax=Variovorax sp. dw_954 TaxID=2720078 RepID=UPI001BD32DA6|nr:DUF1810 domain-containing protein [Variovorax sp. dw_954]
MTAPGALQRFVDAQAPVYETVLAELRAGRKRSHWMWFIFPQLDGLGHSAMARRYAIASLAEARDYLRHPLLGPRLEACSALVLDVADTPLDLILGPPDDLKFRSSMTLFAAAAPEKQVFDACLRKYFGGIPEPRTLALLEP